jgi:5'-nucleotidase (lipoprotein e(P4) family)
MRPALAFTLLSGVLVVGCASSRTAAVPPAPPEAASPAPAAVEAPQAVPSPSPVSPDDDLNAVLWMQRAVEHDLVFREVYRDAGDTLVAALADPAWDALPREEREGPYASLPPAVIADVDETLLDNSPYQAQLILSGQEYGERSWAEWCKKEEARSLPGAVEFMRFAAEHGVTVYYLTNRNKELGAVTLANLRKVGFPVASDDVFLGLGTIVPGCETVGTDKGCRRRLIGRGHRVLMAFGDSIADFVDVVSNTPERRDRDIAPYADWFGTRWWMLPNPSYGSWEPASFNNDWTLSREQRRRAKIQALRPE